MPVRRTWETSCGDVSRFELEYLAGGEWSLQDRADFRELVERGWSEVGAPARLYLKESSRAELDALEGANRARETREKKGREEARSFFDALRQALKPEPPGLVALRSFGLDPSKATVPELQAIYRARVFEGHADKGGTEDIGALVERRNLALAYLNAQKQP